MNPVVKTKFDSIEQELEAYKRALQMGEQTHALAMKKISSLQTSLSFLFKQEERYRRALEEITKLNTEGVTEASIIARTALNEGEEVK